jgi:hypothetical protein
MLPIAWPIALSCFARSAGVAAGRVERVGERLQRCEDVLVRRRLHREAVARGRRAGQSHATPAVAIVSPGA